MSFMISDKAFWTIWCVCVCFAFIGAVQILSPTTGLCLAIIESRPMKLPQDGPKSRLSPFKSSTRNDLPVSRWAIFRWAVNRKTSHNVRIYILFSVREIFCERLSNVFKDVVRDDPFDVHVSYKMFGMYNLSSKKLNHLFLKVLNNFVNLL